jgi:hypothetical protein
MAATVAEARARMVRMSRLVIGMVLNCAERSGR